MTLLRTAGALLLAGLTMAACTGPGAPEPTPVPTPESSASASSAPAAPPEPDRPLRSGDGPGTDGLTVRYQGGDGRIETLHVEDFRR